MSDPITALGNAWNTANALVGIARRTGDIPLQSQIIDLQRTLIDCQSANRALVSERDDLKDQVLSLSKRIERRDELRASLVRRGDTYWFLGESGETGPCCIRCFEAEARAMPLLATARAERRSGELRCPQCNTYVCQDSPPPNSATGRRQG